MFDGPLSESIVRRAVEKASSMFRSTTFETGRMIAIGPRTTRRTAAEPAWSMKAPPIVEAVEATLGETLPGAGVFVMSAGGRRFTQSVAHEFAGEARIALICGHYEGIDARVI